MKKLMKLSLLLVVVALTFSSCNCFKKMAKNSDDVSLTCAPEVLVLNNGVVAADITAQFPVKYFNPKAIVKVTQVVREILADTDAESGAVLYAGDSGVDMDTARAAGVRSVGVTWGFRDRAELYEHGADHVVDRPGEILELL